MRNPAEDNPRSRWAMQVGERIRAAREKRGLTQAELASWLAADPNTRRSRRRKPVKQLISHWENGRSEPTAWDLSRVAKILEVDPNHLLLGTDWEHPRFTSPVKMIPYPSRAQLAQIADGSLDPGSVERVCPIFRALESALRFDIFDNALAPRIRPETSSVVLDCNATPSPGDYVLVALRATRELLFRRFKPGAEAKPGEPPYTLMAEHPDFEPRLIGTKHNAKILGVMVELSEAITRDWPGLQFPHKIRG
jgi:transcriptional regulator with XRE-family HTH domain